MFKKSKKLGELITILLLFYPYGPHILPMYVGLIFVWQLFDNNHNSTTISYQ